MKNELTERLDAATRLKDAGWPQGRSRDVILLFAEVNGGPRLWNRAHAFESWPPCVKRLDSPSASECMVYARERWPVAAIGLNCAGSTDGASPYRCFFECGQGIAGWAEHPDSPDIAAQLALAAAMEAQSFADEREAV